MVLYFCFNNDQNQNIFFAVISNVFSDIYLIPFVCLYVRLFGC